MGYLREDVEEGSLSGDGIWTENWAKWATEPSKHLPGESSCQRKRRALSCAGEGGTHGMSWHNEKVTVAGTPWVMGEGAPGRWGQGGGSASSWWALKDLIPRTRGRHWEVLCRLLTWSDLCWDEWERSWNCSKETENLLFRVLLHKHS